MSTNYDPKRVVPWCSMSEWSRVYKLAYSEDYDDRWEALCKMFLWKSRVQKLPVGVECTLYLLQAILRDQEFQENSESCILFENDLVCLYSTAIVRFVNLISHLGQVELRHQPITTIAEKVGIPDWVVGIRHEATHARMPSLAILRPGSKLAMEWLKINYWSIEEEDSYDLIWPESKRGIARIMQAKKKGNNVTKVQDVPEGLQIAVSALMDLASEQKRGATSLHKVNSKSLCSYGLELWEKNNEDATANRKAQSARFLIPLSQIRNFIMTEIENLCTESSSATNSTDAEARGRLLVSALLGYPNFTLAAGDAFPQLSHLWKLLIQWRGLTKLMEELAISSSVGVGSRAEALRLVAALADALLEGRSKPKSSFRPDSYLTAYDWNDVIQEVLKEPSRDTLQIFSKLCDLQGSRMVNREKLTELLALYCREEASKDLADSGQGVYTVDMIRGPVAPKIKADPPCHDHARVSKTVGHIRTEVWTKCDEFDWSNLPLGCTPDRVACDEVELLDAEWVRQEAEETGCDGETHRARKRMSEKFDWNSLNRKRRKRGGLAKNCAVDI